MAVEFSKKNIIDAYNYLKNNNYNEKLNLFQRGKIAKFEYEPEFEDRLNRFSDLLNNMFEHYRKTSEIEIDSEPFQDFNFYLTEIKYRLIPKTISTHNQISVGKPEPGRYMTNVSSSDKYYIKGLNYFIDCPVDIYLIDVLWSLTAGVLIDDSLSGSCWGNRIDDNLRLKNRAVNKKIIPFLVDTDKGTDKKNSYRLFKFFGRQYNSWRDGAIADVMNLAKKDNHSALFSIDLKSYYYNIKFSFDDLYDELKNFEDIIASKEQYEKSIFLTKLLENIHYTYSSLVKPSLELTHKNNYSDKLLPIGLTSSSILANWYLTDFDTNVMVNVRPVYYGRYVDDMIIVLKDPLISEAQPIQEFIDKYFYSFLESDTTTDSENLSLKLDNGHMLPLQKEKIILQYFESTHTFSVLETFKKDLQEKSSAFRFLPDEELITNLDQLAYDLIYQGSGNTLRSVIGVKENSAELSKYLHSHIILQRLCDYNHGEKVHKSLERYFRGVTLLTHSLQWEKVYQYYLITRNSEYIKNFNFLIRDTIKRVKYIEDGSFIDNKIRNDLELYNDIALSTTIATGSLDSWIEYAESQEIKELCESFRESNLLRHYLIAWPLINYTNFKGDLTCITELKSFLGKHELKIDTKKQSYTPKFIHEDERQLFELLNGLYNDCVLQAREIPDSSYLSMETDKNSESITLGVNDRSKIKRLKAGLAIMKTGNEFRNSISEDSRPNTSFTRQAHLYNILNQAEKEKVDLLVFPEVSIPVSWLPFMISHARQKQIGLVFGLEHWNIKGKVFNFLIEALPYKVNNKYNSCYFSYRLKKHYAPSEILAINEYRLTPANDVYPKLCLHHKVHWKGIAFASYNCFELADINDRALFKSEVDLIIASVSNRDIGYYNAILDSTSRDLHSYVIHVNCASYGASSVIQPTKKDEKRKIYIEGADNNTILTTTLDIVGLREFQYKSYSPLDKKYKALPPGFKHEKVIERMKISK